jgi:hypothetical protein
MHVAEGSIEVMKECKMLKSRTSQVKVNDYAIVFDFEMTPMAL